MTHTDESPEYPDQVISSWSDASRVHDTLRIRGGP